MSQSRLFDRPPGAFAYVKCGAGTVAFETVAGTTYHLLIFDDQTDGAGTGGTLNVSVTVTDLPTVSALTVDPTGSFDPATDAATIHGTVTCSGVVDFARVLVEVEQKVGRGVVEGSGAAALRCDGTPTPWSLAVEAYYEGTKFSGGQVATVAVAVACGLSFCSDSGYQGNVVVLSHNG